MCGRFTVGEIRALLDALEVEDDPGREHRWNVAPSQAAPIISSLRSPLGYATFGLPAPRGALVNVRWESAGSDRFISDLMSNSRCVAPTTGFYEWDPSKRPYLFHMPGMRPFGLAGVRHKGGFAILTAEADGAVARVHGRMPIALDPEGSAAWLSGAPLATGAHRSLEMRRVSPDVNDPRNDRPGLVEPFVDRQTTLF